ncbi:hypothetical protein CYMTET_32608 [Cymbomonas tetramitiformis]|uniref:Uncharacterized protein n=1 Tax=Cymbomonas tetramitiformis TaxID=36881 RepID=A0AAE0FFE0_9CHLO|nr:hypothetical protein CYMTET_32608 [Cymbomonas tetramitiformis]
MSVVSIHLNLYSCPHSKLLGSHGLRWGHDARRDHSPGESPASSTRAPAAACPNFMLSLLRPTYVTDSRQCSRGSRKCARDTSASSSFISLWQFLASGLHPVHPCRSCCPCCW